MGIVNLDCAESRGMCGYHPSTDPGAFGRDWKLEGFSNALVAS